jgi:hypothetical protein
VPESRRGKQVGRFEGLSFDPVQTDPVVIDDFPLSVPVSHRELEVIETYLRAVLDEMIGVKTEADDDDGRPLGHKGAQDTS